MRRVAASLLPLLTTVITGCVADDSTPGEDGVDDVGLADGTSDGPTLSECEGSALLAYLNGGATADAMKDKGVHTRAAENLAAHRDGADGMFGTADDDLFDSLEEVDAVPYVGPAAFGQLGAIAAPTCAPLELAGSCSITSTTFHNGYGYPNTDHEMIALSILLDASNPEPVAGGDPVDVTGMVQVDSPWGPIPGGLWRGWCHIAAHDYQPLGEACAIGPFQIPTGSLGFGNFTSFRRSSDGYSMYISAIYESPRSNYYDDYTKVSYSCSLQ